MRRFKCLLNALGECLPTDVSILFITLSYTRSIQNFITHSNF